MSDVTLDTPELAHHYDFISDAQFISGLSLVGRMGVKEGDMVLDVGCGTGRLAIEVATMVGPSGFVTGIDPSPHRVKIAREKLSHHSNIEFKVGKGEDLGAFSGDAFDNLYYSSVFHWIADKENALAEAYRVLKPGGRIGITMPSPDGISRLLRAIILRIIAGPPYADHVRDMKSKSVLITQEYLSALITRAGFTDLDVEVREKRFFQASAEGLIEFYSASSFGNFLNFIPENLRDDMKQEIVKELEKERTADGIELVSRTIFAMAKKPG
jgi:ubiquinone/menaquinone biosynthesis C-methylase UbiE